jgi:hypothetical protein
MFPVRFALFAVLGLLLLGGSAPAADDLKEPYRLRIVLHLARHRLLTEVYYRQLERELKDGLQAALSKLAQVEVVRKHPRLADVLKDGLQRGLDTWRERSDVKTHFVLVDYAATRYQIQTRQHDGLTGLASPAVRHERTRDRAYVARAAALLIAHDLGLVGTIVSEPDVAGRVKVDLRGGALGVDLGRWVKKGEVMSVVRMSGDSAGVAVPWTYLQVDSPPTGGECVCRLFRRYQAMRVTGLRCVLLGTRSGTMRLRLVKEEPGGRYSPYRDAVQLEIRRRGFEGEEGTMLSVSPPTGTDLDTARYKRGKFDRIAFVRVVAGGQPRARIPVPLIDERLIVLPVPTVDEESTLVLERYRLLRRNVLLGSQVQANLREEINKLTADPKKRKEAVARVKETLQRSRDDHTSLSKERNDVEAELAKVKLPGNQRPSFTAIDNRLKQIRAGEEELRDHIALLEKFEKEEANPKKKEWYIQQERAKLLEKEAEVGQAIAIYEKAPPEFVTKALKAHLADLKKRWEIKGKAHQEARTFIYQEWPTLNTAGLAAKIGDAEKAFETCKGVADTISPFKLLKANEKHRLRLQKEGAELKPDVNITDLKPAQDILDLLPKLQKLDTAIRAYLNQKAGE